MSRFSTAVKQDPGKLRVGAALNILIGGVPAIYYGQELGMTGFGGFNESGNTDGNDIPRREAFEWYKSDEGTGMALWYKCTGPWWDQTNLRPNDGISLEEEKPEPNSLYNFYRVLLHLRANHETLINGRFRNIENGNEHVFSFLRYGNNKRTLVLVNLSNKSQSTNISAVDNQFTPGLRGIFGKSDLQLVSGKLSGKLPPYAVEIFDVK